MSHRAAIYSVRVHKKQHPDDLRPFGDFDQAGSSLIDVFGRYMDAPLVNSTEDETRSVRCIKCVTDGEDVKAICIHGKKGLVADIVDEHGQLRIRQAAVDTQLVRCGSLFHLPPNDTLGWWAVHVNDNRSAKSLIQSKLAELFRSEFDGVMLKIQPSVPTAALSAAVKDDRIANVRLIRLEKPHDREIAATDKWVSAGEAARIELKVTGARGKLISSGLLKRYLSAKALARIGALKDIIEFEGLHFQEAKVEAVLESGKRRTFNISAPESGHAFTIDLDDLEELNGEPTEDSLFQGLGDAIDEMT